MQAHIGQWTISIERDPFTPQDLTAKYNGLSSVWDRTINRLGFDRAYAELFCTAQAQGYLSHLSENAHIFDAGIGTGALSVAMAKTHPQTLTLHGVDISEDMLTQTQDNLEQLGLQADLRTGDATHLPYQTNQFDWTMTAHMLEHLDDPHQGLRELVRVTKSGGMVMVITTRKSILGQYIDWQWRLNRIGEQTLIRWMANAGLTQIEPLLLGGPVWSNWMSMVYIGQKQ